MITTGRISSLTESFGFIKDDDSTEYFFLPMVVVGTAFKDLVVGTPVKFATQEHKRGLRALDVRVLGEASDGR